MRADRLLSILLLLQIHRRMTAGDLAERLEVSERTIHRDMEALSASGIPVMAERGAGGGWALPEGYQTNLTGLKPAEVQALFLTGPNRILADLGLQDASDGALTKLLAALPQSHRRDAEYFRQRVHIDLAGWRRPGESVPFLPALQDAVWQGRQAWLSYQRGDGSCVERLVEPLGLVAKGSVWYLIAAAEGELRSYRASRVQEVRLTDEPVLRPPGFDLAEYWAQSSADFVASLPRYDVRARINPAILGRLRFGGRIVHVEQVETPDPDGWQQVSLRFDTVEEACAFLVGFGPQIEVLEPAALREQVVALARSVVAFYEGRS